jgi:uncharacterized membrane protein
MKEIIKTSFKELLDDRYLLVMLSVMLVFAIISSIIIGLSIHPSEFQLVSHYSAYGISHYYRDQWYYLFVFVFFEIFVALIHIAVSIKLLVEKGRSVAIIFAWSGIGVVILCLAMALTLINAWNP